MPGAAFASAASPAPKKESFMPAAVWVPAAAGVVGSIFQSNAQSRAARAQQQAANQAMQFEREKLAEDRRRYDQRYEFEMAQRRLRDQVARQILSQHGINIPDAAQAPAAPKKLGDFRGPATGAAGPGIQNSLLSLSPGAAGTPAAPPMAAGSMDASPMFDSQGGGTSGLSAPGLPASSMAGLTNWSDELWRRQ